MVGFYRLDSGRSGWQDALTMQTWSAIHDAMAMAVRVVNKQSSNTVNGLSCRVEQVALLLTDGSVWQIDSLLVPHAEKSLSFRAAAWNLKSERNSRRPFHKCWHQVVPARAVAAPTLA